ncbi:P-loop containing nucleoside triphosphate hydrolase protein [Russula brevipes]|nr:P-loop containing nucleoside triphosphate hydrolase protein [Russula brevipes]
MGSTPQLLPAPTDRSSLPPARSPPQRRLLLPPPPEFVNVKVILIGDSSVGKSCLSLRFCNPQWSPEDGARANVNVERQVSRREVNGQKVKIIIWDTAGQERFRSITASYYRGAQGVVLVYDVSSRESFRAIPRWLEEVEERAQPDVVKILVGNKVDKVTGTCPFTSSHLCAPLALLPSFFPRKQLLAFAHMRALGRLPRGADG